MTDRGGVPLAIQLSAGQAHESKWFEPLMEAGQVRRRCRPEALAGDRGYSYPHIRRWCRGDGIEVVIPTRKDQSSEPMDTGKYRERNVVERCIGWLKECRRVATRYEKLAVHYAGFVKLAMIQRLLRLVDPSNRA